MEFHLHDQIQFCQTFDSGIYANCILRNSISVERAQQDTNLNPQYEIRFIAWHQHKKTVTIECFVLQRFLFFSQICGKQVFEAL